MLEERYGSSSLARRYARGDHGKLQLQNRVNSGSARFVSLAHFFRTVFLPQGYPESVSEDYLTYQIWDTVQAFASSITGTLAAQAVLKGVGVGDESATVLAATLTWLLKDGTGMLGRILFAWVQGSSLDCDAKRWRLFADILNDIAIFLEICGPHFPNMFTLIICTAGVFKSIVGVAGGATRAALTQHQARRNNMADVSAKDGSQETLVNLAALLCSLIMVPLITGQHMLIWILYFVFTSLHLYANYSAVTAVVMETISQSRLHILLKNYFESGTIMSTSSVNYREPVFWKTRRRFDIKLGASICSLCDSSNEITSVLDVYRDCRYLLWINHSQREICVSLSTTAGIYDQLQACYQAELINFVSEFPHSKTQQLTPQLQSVLAAVNEQNLHSLEASYEYTMKTFPQFLEDAHRYHWKTDVSLLGAEEWRYSHDNTDWAGYVKKL